jgi:6-phosphogluconolactonase
MAIAAAVEWAEPGDAAAVAERVAVVVARPGTKRIAVPGGSTPAAVFAELADRRLDWRDCEVWPTDDRQVPADHPASNFGKLRAALGDSGATLMELREGQPAPGFDLVWLGMGADGHVASLFPKMTAGERVGPHVIATVPEPLPPEAPFARLSLNLAALSATDALIVAITGRDKRRVLEAAIRGESEHLPIAQMLRAATCPVTIFWSE